MNIERIDGPRHRVTTVFGEPFKVALEEPAPKLNAQVRVRVGFTEFVVTIEQPLTATDMHDNWINAKRAIEHAVDAAFAEFLR